MNYKDLRVLLSCNKCANAEPEEPGEPENTKGTCHAGHPRDDKFPEIDMATGWCRDFAYGIEGLVVPGVVGLTVPIATATVLAAGFIVGTITRVLGEPADTVISQSPAAGAHVDQIQIVDLIATKA